MSKRRRGAKRPPAAPTQPPPTQIPPAAILAETWLLRHMLTRCGAPARDRDDVLQECLIGAVVAVREGRYRPQPGLEPRRILQRWLIGIAVHQARKYHEKACRRREVAVVDPLAYVVGRVPSPHGEVEVRALLDPKASSSTKPGATGREKASASSARTASAMVLSSSGSIMPEVSTDRGRRLRGAVLTLRVDDG